MARAVCSMEFEHTEAIIIVLSHQTHTRRLNKQLLKVISFWTKTFGCAFNFNYYIILQYVYESDHTLI